MTGYQTDDYKKKRVSDLKLYTTEDILFIWGCCAMNKLSPDILFLSNQNGKKKEINKKKSSTFSV